ncbi:S1C family serine protease [Lapillicoccus jejuensis]|uniref:Putative serine protease PepD n=1 Tax=Lapillicoccus jejuensis TaxID=402171 RepID=A0A542E0S4_9MICO|nr:trypsin-like peptidase domain-containing protein [Lapillicoccus jejuensis]TQJ08943.1 putative serine protease PepD [Lapillicoccus jejuensis]
MTQQTHPGGTQHDGDTPREPQWYHGPASSHGQDDRSGDTGRASAFGLGGEARDTSSDTQAVGHPATGELPLTWGGYPGAQGGSSGSAGTGSTASYAGSTGAGTYAGSAGGNGSSYAGGSWGDGGWGGPQGPSTTPTPAPTPKQKGAGRRVAEVGVTALLAAVLASVGTYVATEHNGSGTQAVSTTTSSGPAPVQQADPSNPDWTVTAKAVTPSVVAITVQSQQAEGEGSGVILDNQGHVLTNNHVATGAGDGAEISVTLSDGRSYGASIKGTDPTTDLAVLQIKNPPSDLKPISLGDSDKLVVGQPVMAVGNPLGLAGTVTTGIVSALNRPVTTAASESQQPSQQDPFGGQGQGQSQDQSQDQTQSVHTNAIQTSAAINPGNSGGALVTSDGQLIGINSSIASLGSSGGGSQSGNIGIGFAIPVKEAKSIADQLISTGSAKHAYLGVTASDTSITDGSSKRAAALLRSVAGGTPAASAGLKAGDAVVSVNGDAIESSESLVATVNEFSVGDKVTVTVIRGGQKQDIQVTLAARPGQG